VNTVFLEIDRSQVDRILETLEVETPPGWSLRGQPRRAAQEVGDGDAKRVRVALEIVPPPDRQRDVDLVVRARVEGREMTATAVLHPVPRQRVPRVDQAPALDGTGRGWERAVSLRLGTNHVWQGRIDGVDDASAEVRLVHDGERLWLDAEVRDDRVVSNIEPNDIKGHWRSDAIEICLDPAAGAEDTGGCLKVGVFPFDTTGRVRGARDADARQGPIEETAPGMRLASQRTGTGYRVQAAIPLELIGVRAGRGRSSRVGFNFLVYDGDKADATLGENINEARLAWAPRSGVQGRPEDWGRIDLE